MLEWSGIIFINYICSYDILDTTMRDRQQTFTHLYVPDKNASFQCVFIYRYKVLFACTLNIFMFNLLQTVLR